MLNEKVSSLSINRQIQFGICSISLIIFVLIFLLITLNSFIVIAQFYNESETKIDRKENDYIEAVAFLFDSDSKIDRFVRSNFIANYRLIIENYKRNQDFLDIHMLGSDDVVINSN